MIAHAGDTHGQSMGAQSPHRYGLRVYYEDTDAGGVVYHANYLRFAERARTEALRDLGVPHADMVRAHNLMFMVRRVEVEYLRPARLDDSLTVVTSVRAIAGASVTLGQDMTDAAGAVLARMVVRLACVGTQDGRAARIPAGWRAALERMTGTIVPVEQE